MFPGILKTCLFNSISGTGAITASSVSSTVKSILGVSVNKLFNLAVKLMLKKYCTPFNSTTTATIPYNNICNVLVEDVVTFDSEFPKLENKIINKINITENNIMYGTPKLNPILFLFFSLIPLLSIVGIPNTESYVKFIISIYIY